MPRKKRKIPINKMAQYRHVQDLKKFERHAIVAYRVVMKALSGKILESLKKKKLAKSDTELPKGWTGEVPKIELDLSGNITKIINKHLAALEWVLVGDFASKDAKKAAKDTGLVGVLTPGIVEGAYLSSIDANREHYADLFGELPDEFNPQLLQASMEQIADKAKTVLEQTQAQIKVSVIEALHRIVQDLNARNTQSVANSAHDLLPKHGADESLDMATQEVEAKINANRLAKELSEVTKSLENKWETAVASHTTTASAVGTHQAMYEIYGNKTDNLRVAWVEMEDERVCDFCHDASKKNDGTYKIYSMDDFKPSGHNYGKKKSEWLLTIPPVHPRCRCQLVYIPRNFEITEDGTIQAKGEE
jgi:hypothetical protein